MPDRKIKRQRHPAKSFSKSPLSLYFLAPSCPRKGPGGLTGQDPRSTIVERALQIHLFFAKQSQCQNGQNDHKYSNNKGLCQRTTNNEHQTLPKTNPIKPNSPFLYIKHNPDCREPPYRKPSILPLSTEYSTHPCFQPKNAG